MPHTHTWEVTGYVVLGHPTPDGMLERVITWHCACGEWATVHGLIKLGVPLHTPEFWEGLKRQEQARRTPEAKMAAWQQGRGRRRR